MKSYQVWQLRENGDTQVFNVPWWDRWSDLEMRMFKGRGIDLDRLME